MRFDDLVLLHPIRTFGGCEGAEAGAGAKLLACRLAGLSALEAHHAGLVALAQNQAISCGSIGQEHR
jgi:hypothetical protein